MRILIIALLLLASCDDVVESSCIKSAAHGRSIFYKADTCLGMCFAGYSIGGLVQLSDHDCRTLMEYIDASQ